MVLRKLIFSHEMGGDVDDFFAVPATFLFRTSASSELILLLLPSTLQAKQERCSIAFPISDLYRSFVSFLRKPMQTPYKAKPFRSIEGRQP